jgi:hypothetical protein
MLDANDSAVQQRIATMVTTVELRTGRRLEGDDLERTQRNLLRFLNQIAELDKVELNNADEPDFTFAAYRDKER